MATASSAMNDHRTLSPISEHPIPISKSRCAGSNSTLLAKVTPPLSTPQDSACSVAQSRPLGATAFVDEAGVRDNGPNRRL
jgi:hypothetical protein